MYNIYTENIIRIISPSQAPPFNWYPVLQSHMKLPRISIHIWLASQQSCWPTSHSFMSANIQYEYFIPSKLDAVHKELGNLLNQKITKTIVEMGTFALKTLIWSFLDKHKANFSHYVWNVGEFCQSNCTITYSYFDYQLSVAHTFPNYPTDKTLFPGQHHWPYHNKGEARLEKTPRLKPKFTRFQTRGLLVDITVIWLSSHYGSLNTYWKSKHMWFHI